MIFPKKSDLIRSAIVAVLGGLSYLGILLYPSKPTLITLIDHISLDQLYQVGVMALLMFVGIFVTLYLHRVQQKWVFKKVNAYLQDFRENPATHKEVLSKQIPGSEALPPSLADTLDALCIGYRKALSDKVSQNEVLESLRALVGRMDLEKSAVIPSQHRGNISSRDMVARFTPSMHWLTATPKLQQFLGQHIDHLNGRPFSEVIHEEDLIDFREIFNKALQTGEAHNISFRVRIRKLDGSNKSGNSSILLRRGRQGRVEERYVQLDMLTRYNDLGIPLHVRCYIVDITDRVQTEIELRRRTQELSATNEQLRSINLDLERLKESYRDLYHHAPVMYFSLDQEGKFVTFNETVLSTLGYTREDLFRQSYTRVLSPESKKFFLEHPDMFEASGELETTWVKKDGTQIDVWIRTTPVLEENNSFVRSRSVAQDVTERIRLADELRKRGDELETANKELRQINNSLDEFTRVVSHDLKEPLRTLEAYSNFLVEEFSDSLGPEGANYLGHLVRTSSRMGNLIEDLLALSQAGRILRTSENFDLNEVVSAVCKDLDDLIQRNKASVVLEGELPRVTGDSRRITQLFINLIANGIKYNQSKNPRIHIGEHRHGKISSQNGNGTNFVTLFVTDNGIGIEPAFHEKIFGMFRRVHPNGQYEGTGAGLAIAKKIVEAHGGRIWVESKPGRGSTFFITLPRGSTVIRKGRDRKLLAAPRNANRLRHEKFSKKPSVPAKPFSRTQIRKNVYHLLLVEDMQEIALIAQHLAQRAGQEMTWVPSAEAAWDYLNQTPVKPHLLLLDIHLPGMSGVDLCKRLRETPNLADLTIALFSQLEQPEAAAAGRNAGADFVLSKELLSRTTAWQEKIGEILNSKTPSAS